MTSVHGPYRTTIFPHVSPLSPWPDDRLPLLASPVVGATQSADAERILGQLITAHTVGTSSTGDFAARFQSEQVGPIQVIFQRYTGFRNINITSPFAMIAMTVPLSGDLLVKLDGKDFRVPAGSPLVFNPGAAPRMMGPATADFLTFTIPLEIVTAQLARYLPHVGDGDAIAFGTVASPQIAGALVQAMRTIQLALDRGQTKTEDQRKNLGDTLVSSLLLSYPHNHMRELYNSGPDASDAAVWDVVGALREAPEARLQIASLARDYGVNIRSLQLGFQRLLGVSPSNFQRDLRLERAHQLIQAYHPNELPTVSDLSTMVGYVNAGRFAADFRDRFGLPPSVALAKARTRLKD